MTSPTDELDPALQARVDAACEWVGEAAIHRLQTVLKSIVLSNIDLDPMSDSPHSNIELVALLSQLLAHTFYGRFVPKGELLRIWATRLALFVRGLPTRPTGWSTQNHTFVVYGKRGTLAEFSLDLEIPAQAPLFRTVTYSLLGDLLVKVSQPRLHPPGCPAAKNGLSGPTRHDLANWLFLARNRRKKEQAVLDLLAAIRSVRHGIRNAELAQRLLTCAIDIAMCVCVDLENDAELELEQLHKVRADARLALALTDLAGAVRGVTP